MLALAIARPACLPALVPPALAIARLPACLLSFPPSQLLPRLPASLPPLVPALAGQRQEPLEEVVCEVEDANAGEVIEAITLRKGEVGVRAGRLSLCTFTLYLC